MKKNIYKINITNWSEHNPKASKKFKKIMLSIGFLSDPKIRILSPTGKLLFLSCLLVAGDSAQSQIEVSHESLCFQSGVKSGSLLSQLDQLQSLQLLTYEKLHSLNEMKRNEIKLSEMNSKGQLDKPVPPQPKKEATHELIEIWNSAKNLGKVKHSNKTRDRKIAGLWSQVSPETWREVVAKIDASDFCTGKNDRKWKATFDWLLQPETYLKVLEGKYDNRNTGRKHFENERSLEEQTREFEAIANGEISNVG